jgi:hypothetical protein
MPLKWNRRFSLFRGSISYDAFISWPILVFSRIITGTGVGSPDFEGGLGDSGGILVSDPLPIDYSDA